MGVWGTGILENDVALDVKIEFEQRLNEGKSVADAVTTVAANHRREDYSDAATWADAILALARCALARTDDLPDEFGTLAIEIIVSGVGVSRGWNDPGDVEARQDAELELLAILEGEAEHPDRHIGEKHPDVLIEYVDGDEANDDPANLLVVTDVDTVRVHGDAILGDGESRAIVLCLAVDIDEPCENVLIRRETTDLDGETVEEYFRMTPSEALVVQKLIGHYIERGPHGNGRWKEDADAPSEQTSPHGAGNA